MEVISVIISFVLVFTMGFCTGRIYNLRKMLAELKELQDGLDRIKELDAQIDEDRNRYINSLLAENKQLKLQIELLTQGIGVADGENNIKLTAEDSK